MLDFVHQSSGDDRQRKLTYQSGCDSFDCYYRYTGPTGRESEKGLAPVVMVENHVIIDLPPKASGQASEEQVFPGESRSSRLMKPGPRDIPPFPPLRRMLGIRLPSPPMQPFQETDDHPCSTSPFSNTNSFNIYLKSRVHLLI